MKVTFKTICLFMVLFLTSICVQAQNQLDVVYLKNGSIVRGIIIEQVPNESIKLQTADENIFVFKIEEVEKIGKEVSQNRRYSTGNYRGTNRGPLNGRGLTSGYRGFIDLGFTIGTGSFGEDRVEFSTSHGYQFAHFLYAGFGVGVHYYYDSEVVEIPVFAHLRSEFLNHSISPFIDFKVGYSVYDNTGLYLTPTVGCRFAIGERAGISVGFGYTMQKIKYEYYDYPYYFTESENFGGFSIKLGFDF